MSNEVTELKLPSQIVVRLQSIYDSLKRAERSAADLMSDHPEVIAYSSIAQVAEQANVSQPTFVRLAKRLGYTGFAQMKHNIAVYLEHKKESVTLPYDSITPHSEPTDITQSIIYASIQALNDMLDIMVPEDYERASELLINAKSIAFLGSGDAGTVASSGYLRFLRLGKTCMTASDFDTQIALASALDKDSVCVLVSHSGSSTSVVQAAKLAKASGATTIAITNYPYSHLAKICDISLFTATFSEIGGETVARRMSEMTVLESLFIMCRMRGDSELNLNYERVSRVLQNANKL